MSANDDLANISKSVTNGARDYLLKPLRLQEMRNIWQHVYRKKVSNPDQSCITKEITDRKSLPTKTVNVKLKREEDETTHTDQSQSLFSVRKKTRFTWTTDLHLKFVNAIQELGEGGKSYNTNITCICSTNVSTQDTYILFKKKNKNTRYIHTWYIYIYVYIYYMVGP